MKRLLSLTIFMACACLAAFSQTVVLSGIPAVDSTGAVVTHGTAYITWNKFSSTNGSVVFGNSLTVPITAGTISATLYASDTAGSVYNVLIEGNALNSRYKWKVLAAGGIQSTAIIGLSWTRAPENSISNTVETCAHWGIPYTALAQASTTQDIALFTLPPGWKMESHVREGTPFAGPTGLTAASVSIGITAGAATEYMLPFALFQGSNTQRDSPGMYSAEYAAHTVYLEFKNTTAVSPINFGNGTATNFTAGREEVHVCVQQLP
jgi:hypothetical protein